MKGRYTGKLRLRQHGECSGHCVPSGSWDYFRASMRKHYDIEVPEDFIDPRYRA